VMVALSLLGLIAVVAIGTGIYLTNRPNTVRVPNLVGKTEAQADAALKTAGLVGDAVPEITNNCTTGQVTRTNPVANEEVQVNDRITVYVCSGVTQVQIPETIKGMTQAEAESALKGLGFVTDAKLVDGTDKKGTVVDSAPVAGQTASYGSTVVLLISRGNQA